MVWFLVVIVVFLSAFVIYLVAGYFTGEEPSIKKFLALMRKVMIPW